MESICLIDRRRGCSILLIYNMREENGCFIQQQQQRFFLFHFQEYLNDILMLAVCIGGLHRRHVDGQNKGKFVHKVCIKMAGNSPRRKISLFLPNNMAAMTSHANHQ